MGVRSLSEIGNWQILLFPKISLTTDGGNQQQKMKCLHLDYNQPGKKEKKKKKSNSLYQ